MEVETLKDQIRSFLEGGLTPREEAELLTWIKDNDEHRAIYLREQENLRNTLVWSSNQDLDSSWDRLRSKIFPEKQKIPVSGRNIPWRAMAAVLLMTGIITTALLFLLKQEDQDEVRMVTLRVPPGAKSRFMLPDSSFVWINSGSEITYPSSFHKERYTTLSGEAYFEVKKSGRPFTVETSFGKVKVTGTTFDVKAYKDDLEFTTTLVSGSVTVSDSTGTVYLKPGQQAFSQNNVLNIRNVDTNIYTSWKDGKLIFVREPFPGLMKKLELWYNVKIDYSDPRLGEIWYTGTIEMETITEVMEMVSKAAGVKYSFNNKTRVITIKSR